MIKVYEHEFIGEVPEHVVISRLLKWLGIVSLPFEMPFDPSMQQVREAYRKNGYTFNVSGDGKKENIKFVVWDVEGAEENIGVRRNFLPPVLSK